MMKIIDFVRTYQTIFEWILMKKYIHMFTTDYIQIVLDDFHDFFPFLFMFGLLTITTLHKLLSRLEKIIKIIIRGILKNVFL